MLGQRGPFCCVAWKDRLNITQNVSKKALTHEPVVCLTLKSVPCLHSSWHRERRHGSVDYSCFPKILALSPQRSAVWQDLHSVWHSPQFYALLFQANQVFWYRATSKPAFTRVAQVGHWLLGGIKYVTAIVFVHHLLLKQHYVSCASQYILVLANQISRIVSVT